MRLIALTATLALALTTGCYRSVSQKYSSPGGSFIVLSVDTFNQYLIDPNSRTCTLIHMGGPAMVAIPLDCATLATSYQPSAAHITWVTPPSAPVEPPPVPEAASAAPTPPAS